MNDTPKTDAETPAIDLRALAQSLARYRQPNHGRSVFELLINNRSSHSALAVDVVVAPPRLRALSAAVRSCRSLSCPSVYDPARLRPWLILSPSTVERLGRPRDRRDYADASMTSGGAPTASIMQRPATSISAVSVTSIRLPCANIWRCHAGAGSATACTAIRLSCSASVQVILPPAAPASLWPDAGRLGALDQHHGDQWRNRAYRRRHDVVDRRWAVPACASADYRRRRSGRGVAVLCPAPVRAYGVVANPTWSFPTAALYGSSHYDLPAVLRWFTANIGVHHIHHLCSRIPVTGCRLLFATTPIWRMSAGSLWVRVLHACASCSGMKRHTDLLRSRVASALRRRHAIAKSALAFPRYPRSRVALQRPCLSSNSRLLSTFGRTIGPFRLRECQAHVQTLQTSTVQVRATARLSSECTYISERILP